VRNAVVVVTPVDSLRRALVARLGGVDGVECKSVERPECVADARVVVGPAHVVTTDQCAAMAARGVKVVILTPVPTDEEANLYRAAGAAAYLPMLLDLGPLRTEVERLLR
jgi:hypothetical protein